MNLNKTEQQQYADSIFSFMKGDSSFGGNADSMILHTQEPVGEYGSDYVTGFLEIKDGDESCVRIYQSRPDFMDSFKDSHEAVRVIEVEKEQAKILVKSLKKVFPDLFNQTLKQH